MVTCLILDMLCPQVFFLFCLFINEIYRLLSKMAFLNWVSPKLLLLGDSIFKYTPDYLKNYVENSLGVFVEIAGFGGLTISEVIGPSGVGHEKIKDANILVLSLGQNDVSRGVGNPSLGESVAIRMMFNLCRLSALYPHLLIVLLPITFRNINTLPSSKFPESYDANYIASVNSSIVDIYNFLAPCPCHSSKLLFMRPYPDSDIPGPDGLHLSKHGKEQILLSAVTSLKQWMKHP